MLIFNFQNSHNVDLIERSKYYNSHRSWDWNTNGVISKPAF